MNTRVVAFVGPTRMIVSTPSTRSTPKSRHRLAALQISRRLRVAAATRRSLTRLNAHAASIENVQRAADGRHRDELKAVGGVNNVEICARHFDGVRRRRRRAQLADVAFAAVVERRVNTNAIIVVGASLQRAFRQAPSDRILVRAVRKNAVCTQLKPRRCARRHRQPIDARAFGRRRVIFGL